MLKIISSKEQEREKKHGPPKKSRKSDERLQASYTSIYIICTWAKGFSEDKCQIRFLKF